MKKEDIQKQFVNALKSENLKLTPQRQAVFLDIINSKNHKECDDIYNSLSGKGVDVSRATIYRTLDILEKYNLIRKLVFGDSKARYERKLGAPHHDHMICIETGDIIEFVSDDIEEIQEKIAKDYGYKIIKHVHQLFVKPIKK